MITAPHIGTQPSNIFTSSRLDISIPEEREAYNQYSASTPDCCKRGRLTILISPCNIVILHPRLLDRLQKMNRAPRPKINPILHLPILEPTPTLLLPNSILMELVEVRVDLVDSLLLDFDGFDVLRGDLPHHLHGVFDGRLD